MSDADELDEAIALANGAYGGVPVTAPGTAARGATPSRPRGGGRSPDARSDGRGDEPDRGGGSAEDDELAAPDWLDDRSARRHPRTSKDTAEPGGAPPGSTSRTTGTPGTSRHGDGPQDPAPAHARDVPWSDARFRAARAASRLASHVLPLDEALDHVLDAPLDALTDLPSFDTSAMDGWAVSGPGPWTLSEGAADGGILAGTLVEPRALPDGEAVPIATGARVPPGASAVLRHEYGELDGSRLRTRNPASRPEPGTDIRPRGQECRSGDRLLPAGTTVTPAVLGLAAAAGYDRLPVTRRPRAEVLVLGDELLHRGVPHDGRIRDALGPAVAPWLAQLGADVVVTRRLGDDAEALHEAVATTTADLVVTTGGTARGPVDHLRPTLDRVGARLLIEGVRVRPGHPMLLARLPGAATEETSGVRAVNTAGTGGPFLVGLPGNPLAALSGLVTLAAPLIRTLGDRRTEREVSARLTDDVPGHPRDTRLVPVAYSPSDSRARPLRYHGPAMLRGVATADALAVVPAGGGAAGSGVRVLPLPWFAW
ncbi:molybdopterin molybdotransferase [Streptomyces sp. Amel2xB2]|uniref:molybdopterin molybdotransferase MoeA n=1 Tax=Streptomyces sp. Amel2xB2 TaxID=1305829 RepID=UPI000DBA6C5F|nr:molybdopterin molybdotransferase MoeA [Streptomyces sp. Amel2xB2]RAJ66592.1 molybdopterin molybdotransferase [Streptomyces sp. Amel2xB2]